MSTTYRLVDPSGSKFATAVLLKDGTVLAVPEKIPFPSVEAWESTTEGKTGLVFTLKTETISKEFWNRPLTQIPGYKPAKKLKNIYETLNDDQRLILSLVHKYSLNETITHRGFIRPTRLYLLEEDGLYPIYYNRFGTFKINGKDSTSLPETPSLFLQINDKFKRIKKFPSTFIPPPEIPVVIIENKSKYFHETDQESINKLVNAGYYVEIVLGKRRPNLGTNRRLAELYKRAVHTFFCSSREIRSLYTNDTIEEYLKNPWPILRGSEGQEWFQKDSICQNLKGTRLEHLIMLRRAEELAEASVWFQ